MCWSDPIHNLLSVSRNNTTSHPVMLCQVTMEIIPLQFHCAQHTIDVSSYWVKCTNSSRNCSKYPASVPITLVIHFIKYKPLVNTFLLKSCPVPCLFISLVTLALMRLGATNKTDYRWLECTLVFSYNYLLFLIFIFLFLT